MDEAEKYIDAAKRPIGSAIDSISSYFKPSDSREQEEKITRRGILPFLNNNPVISGTASGGLIGALGTAIKGYGTNRKNRKMAKLKDQVTGLESDRDELYSRIEAIEGGSENKPEHLGDLLEEYNSHGEGGRSELHVMVGVIGVLGVILLGFIRLNNYSSPNLTIGIGVLLTIIFIYFGFFFHKNKSNVK